MAMTSSWQQRHDVAVFNRRGVPPVPGSTSGRAAGLPNSSLQASRDGRPFGSNGANNSFGSSALLRGGEIAGDRDFDRDQVRGAPPRPDNLLRHRSDTTHDGPRKPGPVFPELNPMYSQSRQAVDDRSLESNPDYGSHNRRRLNVRGGAGTPPAYPLTSALLPSPPPLPSYMSNPHAVGNGNVQNHGSAGSRSLPPGRNRPTTPSGSGGSRRGNDEPSSSSRLGPPGSGPLAFEGRDNLPGRNVPEASSRSRSVAGTNNAIAGGSASSSSSGVVTCDKCDGKHTTDQCPHFRNDREKHKDAWVNYGRRGGPLQMGNSGGNFVLKSARVVRQPGDGSCLFHSLAHGLPPPSSASGLRREIAGFVQQNPDIKIAGDTLEEWVRWDQNSNVSDYAKRMAVSGWGGGIEMAACSLLKNVNIHVYESEKRRNNEFRRISCFDSPNAARTIHVLYQGGVHYDALVPLTAC